MTRKTSLMIGSILVVVSGAFVLSQAAAQTRVHSVGQSWNTDRQTGQPQSRHPSGFSRHGGTHHPPGLSRRTNSGTRHHAPGQSRRSRTDDTNRDLAPRLDSNTEQRRAPRRHPPGHSKRN